jgi:hypothetical protein
VGRTDVDDEDDDEIKDDGLDYQYMLANGPSLEDCVALGWRMDPDIGISSRTMESSVIRISGDADAEENDIVIAHAIVGLLTRLWRSESGRVYVTEGRGQVLVWKGYPKVGDSFWRFERLPAALHGIWGLDDRHVYAWGGKGEEPLMFAFDGTKWGRMPSPDGQVIAMHGTGPDRLWAAGNDGLLAEWNGHAWKRVPLGTRDNIVSVFAAGDNEVYAIGYHGVILEGTKHGWSQRATGVGAGNCIAKWKGDVWVAAGAKGLQRLVPKKNKLECVKPNMESTWLDVRQDLLITCPEMIVETKDGKDFIAAAENYLREACSAYPPKW